MSKRIGNLGESLAQDYLIKLGYHIITTNYYTRYGEIDIICMDNSEIVFVEVKTRTSTVAGYPENSLTERKIDSLNKTIAAYLQEHAMDNTAYRLDVIAILLTQQSQNIYHIRNISY